MSAGFQVIDAGFEVPDLHIPIEIHLSKLLAWLCDRRVVCDDWSNTYKDLRIQLLRLVAELPPPVRPAQSQEAATFFDFEALFSQLLSSGIESSEKSLIGRYKSATLRAWDEALRAYQTGNAHIAESSSSLVQIVKYTIPEERKKLQKLQKSLSDIDRKIAELYRKSDEEMATFSKMCDELGIQGLDIDLDMKSSAFALKSMYEQIVSAVLSDPFERALRYHQDFCGLGESPFLNIKQLVTRREIDTKEGFAVCDTPQPTSQVENSPAPALETGIDWGGISFEQLAAAGVPAFSSDSSPPTIDDTAWFSYFETATTAAQELGNHQLSSPQLRNDIITELCELESFYAQRLVETSSPMIDAITTLIPQTNFVRDCCDAASLQLMATAVKEVVEQLRSPQFCRLQEIAYSPIFSDRLATSLREKKLRAQNLKVRAHQLELHRTDLEKNLELAALDVSQLKDRCRTLQKRIESSISSLFANRPVYIIGQMLQLDAM